MSIKCIYCGYDKPESEFTLEHILPRDIGGAACPDLFKTRRVCGRCNSLSGLFIDGAFLKSWFTKNNQSINAHRYVDYRNGSVLPLTYCGILDVESNSTRVCEMWLGPTGDTIYHYHEPIEDRYSSYAGGDPIDLRKKPGDAYLFLATDDPGWIKTVLFSFKEHFKNARRFAANIGIDNLNVFNDFFTQRGSEQDEIVKRLFSYRGSVHKCSMSIKLGYEQRFLFKLAIGLGYNLLGDSYLNSDYYQKLKTGLWEQDYKKRCELGLRGTGVLQSDKTFGSIIGWDGGNTIFLKKENGFIVCIITLGDTNLSVCISDEPLLWSSRELLFSETGSVFVIIPQRGRFCGPITLEKFITHKNSIVKIQELSEIEEIRVGKDQLPPFRSEKHEKAIEDEMKNEEGAA